MKINIRPKCAFNYDKGFVRIEYNEIEDMVYFMPCCNARPKKYIEPIAYRSEYFINNINECIEKYKNFSMLDLNNYYIGDCIKSLRIESDMKKLCNNYDYNKKLSIIENSVSHGCNLKCIMCVLGKPVKKKEQEISKKIYEYLKDLKLDTIVTGTCGEPFVDKNTILDLAKNNKSKTIYITTNGTLLNKNDIEELAKCNVKLSVSIDGITKETYEKIRVGANFEKVLQNIIMLNKFKILSHVNYVVQPLNLLESPDIFFDGLGIKVDYLFDYSFFNDKQCIDKLASLKQTKSYLYNETK